MDLGLLPPPIPAMEGDMRLPPVNAPATAAHSAEKARTPVTPVKKVFFTQDELKVQRGRCGISRKDATDSRVSAQGGRVQLRYEVLNGRPCLSGAASDALWVGVTNATEGMATLEVSPNPTSEVRESSVTVLAKNGQGVTFQIRQAAAIP